MTSNIDKESIIKSLADLKPTFAREVFFIELLLAYEKIDENLENRSLLLHKRFLNLDKKFKDQDENLKLFLEEILNLEKNNNEYHNLLKEHLESEKNALKNIGKEAVKANNRLVKNIEEFDYQISELNSNLKLFIKLFKYIVLILIICMALFLFYQLRSSS